MAFYLRFQKAFNVSGLWQALTEIFSFSKGLLHGMIC